MYVCLCNGITDGQIRSAITEGARTLTDLKATLGVASCCGRCADCASSLIVESCARAEPAGGGD
jgi:bacterioferritin-associated ferredoxin